MEVDSISASSSSGEVAAAALLDPSSSKPTSSDLWSSTVSATGIKQLVENDERIARLIRLAGLAISSLHGETSTIEDYPSEVEEGKGFKEYTSEYFQLLDEIQLSLRTSIRTIRQERITPRTIGTTREKDDGEESVNIRGLRRDVWKMAREALEQLQEAKKSYEVNEENIQMETD
ncbi:hypothetical protein BT69DRAFT_1348654 [Atractiella rhizophila]|nr:hypothetical protein BT69DRAFT_1348654 [Atractiella rhizophila]